MRESQIESTVCEYAKQRGCYVRKFNSVGHRAVPDRLLISPTGDVFFIEFKAPNKKPTKMQLREHQLIERNGGEVYVIDSIKEGCDVIDGKVGT